MATRQPQGGGGAPVWSTALPREEVRGPKVVRTRQCPALKKNAAAPGRRIEAAALVNGPSSGGGKGAEGHMAGVRRTKAENWCGDPREEEEAAAVPSGPGRR